jgi:hypothetical protein
MIAEALAALLALLAVPVTVEKDNSLATPEFVGLLPFELSKYIPI